MQSNLITAILYKEKVVTKLSKLTGTAEYNDLKKRPKVVPFKQAPSSSHRHSNYRLSEETVTQKKKNKASRWIGLISVLAIIITIIPLSQSIMRTQAAKDELVRAQQTFQEIDAFYQTVQGEYERAQNPEYLEKIARRDYYYTHEGEIVFDLGSEGKAIDSQIYQETQINQEFNSEN